MDIQSGWKTVADKEKWAARGASFVAKVKATKVVWFPPEPVKAGGRAVSTATKTGRKTTRKTTGAAKKTAKKTTGAAKKVTNPIRRSKT